MKRIAAFLLALVLLFCFAGCKEEEVSVPSPSVPTPPSSSEPSSSEPSSSEPSKEPSSSEPSSDTDSSEPEPDEPPVSVHQSHFAFSKLTPLQQEYYEKLYEAVTKMQSSWIVLGLAEKNYKADIAVTRNALLSDHPEIFWLPNFYASAIGTSVEERVAMVYFATSPDASPSYTVGRGDMEKKNRELERAISRLTAGITSVDPYEIELQLHDKLCLQTEYSNDPADPMIYTAYGALVNGKANCEGYTRAMQLLLSKFDILSVPVSGIAKNEGHMWNAVYLDGEWYHLDVTWDDTVTGFISHEYFNIPDGDVVADHTFGKNFAELPASLFEDSLPSFNVARPVCGGTANNFFVRSGLVIGSEDLDTLADLIAMSPDSSLEVAIGDSALKEQIASEPKTFVTSLNSRLLERNPDAVYIVESVTLSLKVMRIYKYSAFASEEAKI